MLNHIKDVIGDKAIVYNENFNVDEERQLIAFEAQDLANIIRDVIQICIDRCLDAESRKEIRKLLD